MCGMGAGGGGGGWARCCSSLSMGGTAGGGGGGGGMFASCDGLRLGRALASCDGLRLGNAFASWDGLRPMDIEFTAEGRLEWPCGWTRSTGGADMDLPIWAASLELAGG